ncbi:CocE/NonD family hydrolase [Sphingomonas psychrolutea]|uniref:Glutaryl-7-ACA acylase n=1 Tax=Sphingomonas psychrolutea TaxID=1259676 RepID=A0ABQ1G2L6_9SPHN|nr:CocE/NonD family hydrolase [Sphingomonas psychrolutea]GGA35404.1 glutaryl-7-ACA acylase [Sphingomonas psychrolutea]
MRKLAILLAASTALLPLSLTAARPQTPLPAPAQQSPFTFEKVMVPMRDGAKMETVILRPRGQTGPLPILFQRTPYGVPQATPPTVPGGWKSLVDDGYIFVFQSMRGRFGSDGAFTLSTAVHPNDPKAVDEATDAYDSIDWLVKHVPDTNGKVGMWGVSYPGFAAAVALVHPHPALKAVSPQAAWIDYWQNDDLHRNGALRLSYVADWVYSLQQTKESLEDFPYDSVDTYESLLKIGTLEGLDQGYFKGKIPMATALLDHPDHDSFYTDQNWQKALGKTTVPTLNVAGFWDQEDPWGSWQIYAKQQQNDPDHLSVMVAGPWAHGTWQGKMDKLGNIPLGRDTGVEFREQIQTPFFRYWLHGIGTKPDYHARILQSGSNVWKSYANWPPKGTTATSLYLRADGSLSFDAPPPTEACRDYVSDPANPVPFRERPISPTYPRPEWRWWESADQRFVDHRPDVLSYVSAPLTADLTVTGALAAQLQASTSGTDSDFVVKLIDVLPEDDAKFDENASLGGYPRQLNGYQWPIAMEVRRGRFLASDTKPQALVPGKVMQWDVPLRDHDHVFQKGHRIMVQVQSSWFPVIDRNPQSFVPNIGRAKPGDFVKATQKVCAGSKIALPVMR